MGMSITVKCDFCTDIIEPLVDNMKADSLIPEYKSIGRMYVCDNCERKAYEKIREFIDGCR